MRGKSRGLTPTERHRRRQTVAEMFLTGKPLREIADAVGFTIQTVRKDLQAMRAEEWQDQVAPPIAALARELARLLRLESEAWLGWERSRCDQTIHTLQVDMKASEKRRAAQSTRSQAGDARFLSIVLQAIDRRCKLLQLPSSVSTDESIEQMLNVPGMKELYFDDTQFHEQARGRACADDLDAGAVRALGEPGTLAIGAAPGGARSRTDATGAGEERAADRADAAAARQE